MCQHTFVRLIHILLMAASFTASTFVIAQDVESIYTPKINTFALNPDNLGAIGNSVNLFTGDVALPLNLVSLPGRNGLDVSVTISCNGNIQSVADIRNLEAPTGILGLGWSMDYEKIVVDHKGTGSRNDDDFYLVAGGVSNLLVRTGSASAYETKNYQFWKISYDDLIERWVITRENGITYVYGDNNSNRNTVQWGVKWGNWIGSSSDTTGQQQFALAWNLSEIYDAWGNRITFEYENVNRYVRSSTGGKQYTEASYLKKITDVLGRTVVFNHGAKYGALNPDAGGKVEYQDPYAQTAEPDAYQERLETKYLDYIEVFSPNNVKLHTVSFGYAFLGAGDLAKRLLSSITTKDANGKALPNLKLEYNTISPYLGMLKKVTFPEGGSATFNYTTKIIQKSNRALVNILAPTGFGYPHVFTANDYCIVTWLNENTNTLRVYAYLWDGEWIGTQLTDIGNVTIINQATNAQSFGIVLENDFFAIVNSLDLNDVTKPIYLFHKKAEQRGAWHVYSYPMTIAAANGEAHAWLASGNDFAVVVGKEKGKIYRFRWDGAIWQVDSIDQYPQEGDDADFYLAATNNYFIWHYHDTNPDLIKFYYLDETGAWSSTQLPSGLSFNTSQYQSLWYANNSLAVVLAPGTDEFSFRWDPDFAGFYRDDVIGAIDDASQVGLFEAAISTSSLDEGNTNAKGLRWNGNAWNAMDFTPIEATSHALGNDFIIRRNYVASGWIHRWVYNPNTQSWFQGDQVTSLYTPRFAVFNDIYAWYMNTSGQSPQAKIYKRAPTGFDAGTLISPWSAYDNKLLLGNDFYVYEDNTAQGTFVGSSIGYAKNAQWFNNVALDGNLLDQVYINTIVTRNASLQKDATEFRLYRFVDKAATGFQKDYPVKRLDLDDGYQATYTYYKYDTTTATYDPTGMVAQYNEVEVIPGSSDGIAKPFGSTKNYFFNGLPYNQSRLAYPPNDAYTNARDYYNLLEGLTYATKVYDQNGTTVDSTANYWKVVTKALGAKDQGAYARLMKTTSVVDGVEKIVENTYNNLGLTLETKTYNYNWDGNLDTLTQNFKYWYEAYDTSRTLNLLTPVIQTTTKTNTTVTSVSATTWKEWFTGKWAPHKTYQWKGTGSSNFNFDSWSGSGEPTVDWLKTSEILTMLTEGAVLKTKDIDGIYQSTLYDYPKLRPIAAFSNARISQWYVGDEASFINFEFGSATSNVRDNDYWEFPAFNSISSIAHTGRKSCSLNADNNSAIPVDGPRRDFRPPDTTGQKRKYVLSCWVRTQAGFGANKGQLIIHSKQDFDNYHTPYPNVPGAYIAVNFSDTQGKWQYVEAFLDLKQVRADGNIANNELLRLRCYPVNYDDTHYLLVDDLRLSPLDAPFAGTVYDPDYDVVTATIGTNGETVRSVYDNFQRPIATVGPNENVTSVSAPYYSRNGDNDAFAPNDPNSSLSATARYGGVFDDFNDGDANGWDLTDGNWQITSDGKLKNTGVDAGDHAVLLNFSYANYGVRAQIKHLSGSTGFGIKIGNILVQWIGKWELRDGGTFVKDETVTPLTDHWLLITSDKAVFFFADGKLIFKEIRPATISGQLKLYTGAVGTQVTFDDILVFRDPQLSMVYLDGAGKQRQAQTLLGVKCQVSETVYDDIGRPAVQTKTADFNNTLFGFRAGFVTGMNWTLGDMSGEVDDYYSFSGAGYSDDENFPYTRELYENSPLGRVVETGLPGLTFAVGRSHTALASYTKNNNDNFYGAFPAGSFPLGQYFETINISPDGVWTHTLTDKAGNTIATRTGPNDSGIHPTTSYQYDDFGNVIQIYPPNYHNPPAGSVAGDWPLVMSYDFFGRLKQKTMPDAQATYFYIYDKAGRLRFMMDANGAAQNPDHIQYWKYDALGRAIECGYIVQDWNATTLQNYADTNPTWPSTPATWRKKYTYDYNGTTPYLKGRLYKVETNNDGDTTAEVEETFAYDIYGNVVNKTARVLDYNASSYGITYEYDHGGNVTRMMYIPASLVLQNETVIGVFSYSAADSITAGPAYTVAPGANVVLQAGKKIRLVSGFTAQQGSFFNAKIDPFLTQDATVVTYSYDALGRLISVGTPSDTDFYSSYTYHADERLNAEILANGAETRNHFYNPPGWLLRIDGDRFTEDITLTTGWSGAAGYYDGRIKTTSFTYNWAGKPADYAVQYTYDNLGQLTIADNNLNNAWDIGVGNSISYDANGNILDLTRGSTTKNYAYYTGTNKVQNFDGSGNDYGYDANANVTRSDPKTIPTITYDSFTQRPISVSMSSGTSLSLEYGGDTQRVLKNYNNGTSTNSRLYLHGDNDYPLMEKNKTSATAETLAVYIYGANGVIAKRVGSTVLFLLKDHLGSTRVVMDATGLVRTYYDYDALGNLIRTGTVNEVKYQFTGQEYDESGVHNYRARLYDSDLGKFYAVDPAGQGWSPYAYAGNNYVIVVDRDGRAFFLAPILIGAAVGAIWGGATYAITPGAEGFTWGGFFSAAGIGALGGALGGAASLLAPAGIIPGALYGAGTGGVIGGLTSELAGGDFWSGFIPGAIGGGIGGGIGGYQQAKGLGRNIWTGAAPDAVPAPVPLSAPVGDIPIRGGGQTTTQGLVDAPDVVPSGGAVGSAKSSPWRPSTKLSDVEQVQSMLSGTFDPQEAAMLRNHFQAHNELYSGGMRASSLRKPLDAGGTLRAGVGANRTHYRVTSFINRGDNVQIVVLQRSQGTTQFKVIQNVLVPRSMSPIVPNTIYRHGYGVIR